MPTRDDLLLAVLVSRLGGRQVVTGDELDEARRLRLERYRVAGGFVVETTPRRRDDAPLARPALHLEGEA